MVNAGKKNFICDFLFLQHIGEALLPKALRVQQLVAAACSSGKRDQERRLAKRQQLADGVRSGTGDYDICGGEQILQFFADITILYITGSSLQGFIHVLLAADMNHLKFLQKFRKNVPHGGIYRNGTKTAADNQKHRLVRCKFCDLKTLQAGAGQQLLADRATGYDRLSFRKVLQCLREVAADLRSGRNAQLVCQAGRHVGLMDYCRDLALLCSKNHGNRYETAL